MPVAEADRIAVMVRLFAEVFEIDTVGPDDNFFHLGGDSLLATSLMAGIEREFGVTRPISSLLEEATPRQLAATVLSATDQQIGNPLIVIRDGPRATPLCCVHGMNGEAVFPRRLADSVDNERPVYGFRAIGLLAGERPLETVRQIASTYVTAVRQVRPDGPYLLLGHCGGSLIAYEMAQQLAAAGESIPGLVLIDPPAAPQLAPFLFKSGDALQQAQIPWRQRTTEVQANFEAGGYIANDWRRQLLKTSLHAAVATYAPEPYAGPTLVLHTSLRAKGLLNRVRGFPTLLGNGTYVEIESRHMNMFEQHMPEIAATVAEFVNRVAPLPRPEQASEAG